MRPCKPDVVIVPAHLGVSSCPPARPRPSRLPGCSDLVPATPVFCSRMTGV